MNSKHIIRILNDKSITVENILNDIKKTIEKFQSTREDFLINEFRETIEKQRKRLTETEISEKSQEIFETVQADTKAFVLKFVDDTTDFILDCINEHKVPLESAHTFLLILSVTNEVFAEQNFKLRSN